MGVRDMKQRRHSRRRAGDRRRRAGGPHLVQAEAVVPPQHLPLLGQRVHQLRQPQALLPPTTAPADRAGNADRAGSAGGAAAGGGVGAGPRGEVPRGVVVVVAEPAPRPLRLGQAVQPGLPPRGEKEGERGVE